MSTLFLAIALPLLMLSLYAIISSDADQIDFLKSQLSGP